MTIDAAECANAAKRVIVTTTTSKGFRHHHLFSKSPHQQLGHCPSSPNPPPHRNPQKPAHTIIHSPMHHVTR
jgi:hypothetical protein